MGLKQKMSSRTKNWTDHIPFIAIAIILLLNIFYVSNDYLLGWDESVYVGMGKNIAAAGKAGLFEPLRPLIFPVLIGLGIKTGIDSILIAKIIVILASCASVFLIWKITKKIFDEQTAAICVLLFSLTPLFVLSSTQILTENVSIFFVLLSIYFFISDEKRYNYAFAGIFAALAFLTRFPQGLLLIAYIIIFAFAFAKGKKNERKKTLKNAAQLTGCFFIVVLPYLIFNYFSYKNVTGSAFDAVTLPFQMGAYVIYYYQYFYNTGYLYYFTEILKQNVLFAFAILGVFFLAKTQRSIEKKYVILTPLAVYFIFLELMVHKESRYLAMLLPFIAILAAYAIIEILNFARKWKNTMVKIAFIILIVIVLTLSVSIPLKHELKTNSWARAEETKSMSAYFKYAQNKQINGNVITTDPRPAAYSDAKIIPIYYTLDYAFIFYPEEKNNAELVFYTPDAFPCERNDLICRGNKEKLFLQIQQDFKIINETDYYGLKHYILIKK